MCLIRAALVAQLVERAALVQRLSVLSSGHGFDSCLWPFAVSPPSSLNSISCLSPAVLSMKAKIHLVNALPISGYSLAYQEERFEFLDHFPAFSHTVA